jgi:hypothetical protein
MSFLAKNDRNKKNDGATDHLNFAGKLSFLCIFHHLTFFAYLLIDPESESYAQEHTFPQNLIIGRKLDRISTLGDGL